MKLETTSSRPDRSRLTLQESFRLRQAVQEAGATTSVHTCNPLKHKSGPYREFGLCKAEHRLTVTQTLRRRMPRLWTNVFNVFRNKIHIVVLHTLIPSIEQSQNISTSLFPDTLPSQTSPLHTLFILHSVSFLNPQRRPGLTRLLPTPYSFERRGNLRYDCRREVSSLNDVAWRHYAYFGQRLLKLECESLN